MGEVSDKTDKPPRTRFFQLTSGTFVHTQRSADSLKLTCSFCVYPLRQFWTELFDFDLL